MDWADLGLPPQPDGERGSSLGVAFGAELTTGEWARSIKLGPLDPPIRFAGGVLAGHKWARDAERKVVSSDASQAEKTELAVVDPKTRRVLRTLPSTRCPYSVLPLNDGTLLVQRGWIDCDDYPYELVHLSSGGQVLSKADGANLGCTSRWKCSHTASKLVLPRYSLREARA